MRNILYIVIFVLVASCTSNTIFKKPDDLISKEKMVDLLTDMYLSTAAKQVKNTNGNKNIDYLFLVFEKHGIDTARFSRSNYYYTTIIDEYESIYQQVEKRIKNYESDFKGIKRVKDSIKKDSIKRVKFINDSIYKIQAKLDSIKNDSLMRAAGINMDSIIKVEKEIFEEIKDSVFQKELPRGRETIF